ncbi:MAG: ERCC4 domain-containing protein [Phycisphaerae bacterium]|nr:ERCC4 domain-containing protein [Phycisphaerae bacterium]
MKIEPVVIIDTREQDPLTFANLPSERATLDTGDYSILGLERLIAVERKTLTDLLACCGRDRERFRRELQRLRAYRFRLLVVEIDAQTLERGDWRGKLQPAHVLGSLAAWTAQYSLPVWLAGSHEAAARFVERWLYQAARVVVTDYSAAVAFIDNAPSKTPSVSVQTRQLAVPAGVTSSEQRFGRPLVLSTRLCGRAQ